LPLDRRPLRVASLLALVALAATCRSSDSAPAEAPAPGRLERVAPRPWEHERSDVPVDARIRFGALDNGLRWAWAANPEPKERVYLRLHVDVGSLAEEEDERGLAHFLEHMAFNGSRNFPAGTLIEWFQRHGMSFGADTNAHTSFSETVYKLDLPNADPATIREGLQVLRDFADGLLLAAEEIEREKGVIDGEERERDSAAWRLQVKQLDLFFDGTRIPARLPIGKQEVRARFTAEGVRAFYEKWYRPDAMTLVAVGDLGTLDPAPLFAAAFADMQTPATPLPAEPAVGRPTRLDRVLAIHEPEIPSLSLSIQKLVPWEEEPFVVAEWLEDLPLQYARSMLNLRFSELAKQEATPFLGAGVGSAAALEVLDGETLTLASAPEKWEAALAAAEQELRKALEFGFRQAELDEVRADALRGLDEAVEREKTAHSNGILEELLTAAESEYVPTDAATTRAILRPTIEALTLAQCQAAFSAAWSAGELSLSATGNLDLGPEAEAKLRAAFAASAAVPVAAEAEEAVLAFAYASDPALSGPIAARTHVEDLDFTTVRFANGVVLNVKRTDFKERQILFGVHLGEGELTLAPEQSALNFVAGQVFGAAGLVAHSDDDLRRLTAGKVVGLNFSVAEDSFLFGGATTREDLLFQLELLCAQLEAPGWRTDGLVQFRRELPLLFEGLAHQHQGPLVQHFMPALFANDPRQSFPAQEAVATIDMDDVRAWLAPEFAEGALEVAFVGDLDLEETIALAARTLGRLPARRDWRALDERRNVPAPLPGLRQTHTIETQVPKSLVLIAFPFPDGLDTHTRRAATLLGNVVNDRLRLEVREKLGATYSPGAGTQLSTVYPGVGLLMIQAMADPDKVETLVEACLGVARSLSEQGVTEEEVARLKEPLLKQRRDGKRQNSFWLGVLVEATRKPHQLDDFRSADAFYEGHTAADLTPLARRHLAPEKASILVVNPE